MTAQQCKLHINYLELLAAFLALMHFRPVLTGQHVLIRTIQQCFHKQAGRNPLTSPVKTVSLSVAVEQCSLSVSQSHSCPRPPEPRSSSSLQGGPLAREWWLHPVVVAQIWDCFGRAEVDLFASRANTHCPLFFSMTDSNAPLGMDALAHPWPNTFLYAFPPVEMILPVLESVRQQGLSLILVAPRWPAKSWYAEIISPELWQLHAYLLRGPT